MYALKLPVLGEFESTSKPKNSNIADELKCSPDSDRFDCCGVSGGIYSQRESGEIESLG